MRGRARTELPEGDGSETGLHGTGTAPKRDYSETGSFVE